jgi:hypothetical protein
MRRKLRGLGYQELELIFVQDSRVRIYETMNHFPD